MFHYFIMILFIMTLLGNSNFDNHKNKIKATKLLPNSIGNPSRNQEK